MFIDSIISSAYDYDEMQLWQDYRQEISAPYPSTNSEEEIDFESSSEEPEDTI